MLNDRFRIAWWEPVATLGVAMAAAGAIYATPMLVSAFPQISEADWFASSRAEIDVSKIPEGGEVRLLVNDRPILVRHRTRVEIEAARAGDLKALPYPERDEDRVVNPAILVVEGNDSSGCVVVGPTQGMVGDFGGYYDPCKGSHYDTSGRLRKGPGTRNLTVVRHTFTSPTILRIDPLPNGR